ncbi:MAG TPA: hypothetical protein VGL20_14240 [Candidatus Dormibacteraeota bacterium]|jgi:hypothetical protein
MNWAPRDTGRAYVATFGLVLTRLEEAMTGERMPDRAATLATLVERLEEVSGSTAPAAVRSARTPVDLHTRLLDWQDGLEVRDGASRHQAEVRRPPNVIGMPTAAPTSGRSAA